MQPGDPPRPGVLGPVQCSGSGQGSVLGQELGWEKTKEAERKKLGKNLILQGTVGPQGERYPLEIKTRPVSGG